MTASKVRNSAGQQLRLEPIEPLMNRHGGGEGGKGRVEQELAENPERASARAKWVPTRIRPKCGPETRVLARKHYCVTSSTNLILFGLGGGRTWCADLQETPRPTPEPYLPKREIGGSGKVTTQGLNKRKDPGSLRPFSTSRQIKGSSNLVALEPLTKIIIFVLVVCCFEPFLGQSWPQDPCKPGRL
jgi:hypothetical protein